MIHGTKRPAPRGSVWCEPLGGEPHRIGGVFQCIGAAGNAPQWSAKRAKHIYVLENYNAGGKQITSPKLKQNRRHVCAEHNLRKNSWINREEPQKALGAIADVVEDNPGTLSRRKMR